jgi:uncharacterized small protein (DUF1192 family)
MTVQIDGKDYDLETLSHDVRAQLQMIQIVDAEIQRLNAQLAIHQTARKAYAVALNEALAANQSLN